MIYLQLFLSFLQIGMFSFGGGYAAMPLIQGQVVTAHHWLSMEEFTDLITISQMTPGPIAINSATFVGTKIAGTRGRPRGHLRMHPAVLHHRDLYRQTILKIQKSGTLTGDLKLPASRGRRFDRLCRDLDPHHRVLGQSGSGRPREHKLASCCDLRCLRCPASEV